MLIVTHYVQSGNERCAIAFVELPASSVGMFQNFHSGCLEIGAARRVYPLPLHVRQLSMTLISLPQPHEQRKIEKLLLKLSKVKPISAKTLPIQPRKSAIGPACTANAQVFFST